MESIYFTRTASPVGPLVLALSARGLLKLEFDRGQPAEGNDQTWQESAEALAPWLRELNEYFDGYRQDFLPGPRAPTFNCNAGAPCSTSPTARAAPTATSPKPSRILMHSAP